MIDLHVHSTCSDGSETPERVVELAAAAGCTAMALTDHDGLAGVARAGERAKSLGTGSCRAASLVRVLARDDARTRLLRRARRGPLQSELERLRRTGRSETICSCSRLKDLGLPVI